MFNNKKAEMGIGTLIIFIAMILVAAIAAAVLIQTATSLQNKALLTGERSKGQVATSVQTLLLYAEDGGDQSVEYFYQKLKLAPGSDAIKFDDALIEFDTSNVSADLKYISGACVHGTATSGFYTSTSTYMGNYTVEYLIEGSSYKSGYLQRGDVVRICYQSPRNITEDEDIQIHFIPKIGNVNEIEAALPDIMTDQRVFIYP